MAYSSHEKVIEYYRKWRDIHREKLRRKARERYAINREKEKSRHFTWTQKNRGHLVLYEQAWRKRNKDKVNADARIRHQREKQMSNQLKGRLWLMGFGLNLSASVIHIILHNYITAGIAFSLSYASFLMVTHNYIDKAAEDNV